ncbi:PREDICTED: uncharacterized protein LOC105559223, partial [Vollenhovia emeryi]|uniref:uncharacterized protein LOC105559223 n=1 Tax=Vollenhovia emeryi TaxID=411798 RepID=UPI0005F51CEB
MALFIINHCALRNIDHLCQLNKKIFNTAKGVEQIQLGRTKCTGIIKNIIAPHFISDLREDIGDSPYSLLIDESTDISVSKQLGNMRGLGTDNAAVMTGVNTGVYQRLKADIPHLILIRCVCHSIQLAVSESVKEVMPKNLEFLISGTYTWFS